ncbi:MAG: hypothetical protein GY850_08810 [bacterium]|nr:hypothetical protein [bacterium]
MIDEKNLRQNSDSDNDDSSDDEIIIDLTEEIDIKPKGDNSVLKSTGKMDIDDPLSLVMDGAPKAENDDKFFSFDEIDESQSAEDDADRDLPARIADAREDPVEDQLIASAMEFSLGADQDEDREITEEFDLSADEDDDILTMDAARDETEENFSIIDGGEIAENQKDEGLFDLAEDISLDYGFDNDDEDIIDLDDTDREEENQNFANQLLADSKKSDQEDDSREATDFLELDSEKPDDRVIADADREENTEVIALAVEDSDNDDLPEIEAISGLDFEDDENTDVVPEDEKEIIEITEFDQHFPTNGESLLKKSGMLDRTAGDKDEFIELIDADKDSVPADEEIVEFSDSPLNMDDAALDQFFSEELKDDQPLIQKSESIFSDEKEDKEFEMNLDAGAIAKQVDRLDTFLFKDSPDEPALAALDADRAAEKETRPEDSQAGPEIDVPLALSPGQVDAAIERVIREKFSDKIEDIIYEVIEKAVAKEITRLKNSLIGNHSIDEEQI